MSVDREVPSEREKKSYFCKVCQVACLNSDGLHSHYKDEEHEKMEEAYYGQRYGKQMYSCLQDYISSPMRKEPLIGLQYIIQLYPEVDSEDSFKCSLCKVIGHLYFIIKHIESFKHRKNYLSIAYKHLLPANIKQSFYQKSWAVREQAIKVEEEERTLTVNDLKSCASRIGVKSDFWNYNLKRQEKLEEYKKKLSAYETQKETILQYMETFVITSPEEAALVQNLTEQLEAAVNVFNQNTKPRHEKSYKRGREQSTEDGEGQFSRHSGLSRRKRRSIWYEKEHKPSSSSYNDEVKSISDKHSATEEGRTRKRSRSASKDMLLKVTFSTGSEGDAKNADLQREHQELSTACPASEQLEVASGNICETTMAVFHNPHFNSDHFQEIRAKRIRKYSTDVAKWESLFANHRPETNPSIFSWSPKSPSSNNTEVSPSVEKKEKTRRASLDALSTFTLFSQEGHEHGPAGCPPSSDTFSSLQSPGFKYYKGNMFQNIGPQHEPKQVGGTDLELPCSSNTVCNETGTTDDVVMRTEPGQHDECKSHQNAGAETSCDLLSDVNANVAQVPKSSHILHSSPEYSDLKACGSKHMDSQMDSQNADSSVLGNTLTSGKLHASGRQLSPEVLQLFKGKDTDSIVHILKTLSPFYPALQELDLEVFAKVLSKTGAITE